jgi:hypothetical protein
MAKPTLRSTTVPVMPREESFLTMRKSLSNEVKAIFTVHDTHIGLANDAADLTVNGAIYVSAGMKGALKLPNGSKTIQAGENVVVEYNDDGSVKISTQAGQDISYILTTVESFDSRVSQSEAEIDVLQDYHTASIASLSWMEQCVNDIQSQNVTICQSIDSMSESFFGFNDRIRTAEVVVQGVLDSEAAQNSRLTSLEDGLYEERLARTTGDYTLTTLYNTLNASLNSEISNRATGDATLQSSLVAISSSLSNSVTSLSGSLLNLGGRVAVLEVASSSFSSRIDSVSLGVSSLSSSITSEIDYLKALLLENAGLDASYIVSLNELSSSFSSRMTTLGSSLTSISSSFSSQIGTLRGEISSSIEFYSDLQTSLDSLEGRTLLLENASGSFSSSIEELFSSLTDFSGSFSLELGGLTTSVTSLSSSVAYEINDLRSRGGGGGGISAAVGQFAFNELPIGVIDGENDTFELSNTPSPPGSLMLFHNGQLLRVGESSDYVLNGKIITFVNGSIPKPDDVVIATYQYVTATKSFSFNESITLTMTGNVLQGVLEFEPDPPNSLMLFYNGQLLSAGATGDYTLSGKNVEINSTTLQQDDVCLATYSHY